MTIYLDKEMRKGLREWLSAHHFKATIRKENGGSWSCIPDKKQIYVPTTDSTDFNAELMSWFRDHNYTADFDIITLSFLHELGHCITRTTDLELNRLLLLEKYNSDTLFNSLPDSEKNRLYWDIPFEAAANEWAINFCEKHPAAAQRLENILASCIKNV